MSLPTELLPDPLPPDPLPIASAWLAEAWRRRDQPNPDAMVLATCSRAGVPSARVVLCKELAPQPGYIVFFTNYESRKGRELEENPRAAAVMHWDHLHRQVRIEGPVIRAPAAVSDSYFASRPWQRRIGAWASRQSQPVHSRSELLEAVTAAARRLGVPESAGDDPGVAIPRPPFWGGYQLWAESVELWVEGEARIHDRARWTRTLKPLPTGGFEPGPWTATRLQP